MLYEVLARIIGIQCLHIGTPLSAQRISALLDGLFDTDLIEGVCLRMQSEGKLFHVGSGTYTVRSMFKKIACTQILISREYQELGMTLMEVDNDDLVRRILPEAEHRFLEIKPSTIGGTAGMGLFVRCHRRVPLGCVVCEYRGRGLEKLPPKLEQGVYVVHVRNTSTYIDGVSAEGEHLSLATFINDNGPRKANAGMMEYAKHPGRVFVVANRDIQPGEEVFVLYGATYWGFASYGELARQAQLQQLRNEPSAAVTKATAEARHQDQPPGDVHRSRHAPAQAHATRVSTARKRARGVMRASSADGTYTPWEEEEQQLLRVGIARTCRSCGDLTLDRAARLHNEHCGDPLVRRKLMRLDCMPLNEFTALDCPHSVLNASRSKAQRRARMLVKLADPQTFSHTFLDVVRDLEFTFEDADDDADEKGKERTDEAAKS